MARSGHVIPGMLSHQLVSVVTLYNTGCRVVFEEWGTYVTVKYRGNIVMEGENSQKLVCGWYQSRIKPMLANGQFLCTEMSKMTQILV